MIKIYTQFPDDAVEYELFMVVPPPSNNLTVAWGVEGVTGNISLRGGASTNIQPAAGFKISKNFQTDSLSVLIASRKSSGYAGSGGIKIDIRSLTPSGQLVASSEVLDFNTGGNYQEIVFNLSTTLEILADTLYFVCMSLVSPTGDCLYQIPIKSGGEYSYRMSTTGGWSSGSGQVPIKLTRNS